MIIYPDRFKQAVPCGFDGVFEWDFLKGAFGKKIMPMDIDALVERFGNFLLFETKDIGVPVPIGQMITLNALHKTGLFTVFFIYGKLKPEACEIWTPHKRFGMRECDSAWVYRQCCNWYKYACNNPR